MLELAQLVFPRPRWPSRGAAHGSGGSVRFWIYLGAPPGLRLRLRLARGPRGLGGGQGAGVGPAGADLCSLTMPLLGQEANMERILSWTNVGGENVTYKKTNTCGDIWRWEFIPNV